MVRQLLPQVMLTVPAATPGPVPSLSAIKIMSPVVIVEAALTFTSWPATAVMLPVMTVVAAVMATSFTAVKLSMPVVVLVAADTFTSCPAVATTLPLMPVTAAAMFTSFTAFIASVVVAVQDTGSLTLTLPSVPVLPALLCSVTLFKSNAVLSAAPVMLPVADTA